MASIVASSTSTRPHLLSYVDCSEPKSSGTAAVERCVTGFPVGFGGWTAAKLYERRTDSNDRQQAAHETDYADTARQESQIQAYTSWVNAQLKKKHGRQCISSLVHDMQDGTAFADLIEVVAGETLPGIIRSPSNKNDMLLNVSRVINFMSDRNIRMHVTYAEDIVNGKVNSIMRLVLALAAHYKPNSVRESRHRSSLASYAQAAAVSLADSRRTVAAIGHRPKKPFPSSSESSHSASPALQKSVSQDFTPGYGDSRHYTLAERYAKLSRDYEHLKTQYLDIVRVHEDVCTETKSLKNALLVLRSLLLNNELDSVDAAGSGNRTQVMQSSIAPVSGGQALLSDRLMHSEEPQKDVEEEIRKGRSDCINCRGAEAGLQQLVRDQQKRISLLESELQKISTSNGALEESKTTGNCFSGTNHIDGKTGSLREYDNGGATCSNSDYMSTKLVYFYGSQSDQPCIAVICRRADEVTLKDVQSVVGRRGKYQYHFQTQTSDYGIIKTEISDLHQLVPAHNGTVTVWIEDVL